MLLCTELKTFFKMDTTTIDNFVFRLHYRVTTVILLAFSILVLCKQHFGVAITCRASYTPLDLINTFCWIHATFSVQDSWDKKVGIEVPYPGVDIYKDGEKLVYHTYYQWVWLVLLLQAILFYIPRYFWKVREGGRLRRLVVGLNSPILLNETNSNSSTLLVKYMTYNINSLRIYFVSYVTAEVMNFLNIVGQIFLVDAFLGGEFLTFGLQVIEFKGWKGSASYDPMLKLFPRLAKCTYYYYEGYNSVGRDASLCMLPINILNEKIYLFLWFWLFFLALLSGIVLVYRAFIVLWPKFRLTIIRYRTRQLNQDYFETIISKGRIGDWLILNLLSKNLDLLNFCDVNDSAKIVDDHELKFISSCNL